MLESALHSEASHAEPPTRARIDHDAMPKFDPNRVRELEPVDGWLVKDTEEILGESYENELFSEPVSEDTVTSTEWLMCTPGDSKQRLTVSPLWREDAHAVPPTDT